MRLNREKILAVLALVPLVFGIYLLVSTQVVRYPTIQTRLNPDDQEVPPIEPNLYVGKLSGNRNPFQLSTEWRPVTPEPLPPPPLEIEMPPRISFGWVAERGPGAPILYRTSTPKRRAAEEDGAEGDALDEALGTSDEPKGGAQ